MGAVRDSRQRERSRVHDPELTALRAPVAVAGGAQPERQAGGEQHPRVDPVAEPDDLDAHLVELPREVPLTQPEAA